MTVLVIDVGGSSIKVHASGRRATVKIPSGRTMTAKRMVRLVQQATRGWTFDAVTIGYPGPVVRGAPAENPVNLGGGWKGFNFRKAFGRPVKIINDAAMQALGSYRGGRMLFLGLGTGLGSALIVDGVIVPLEIAHLPFKKGRTYEEHVGKAALKRCGRRKWQRRVEDVVKHLRAALQAEDVVLGGGNVKHLARLPAGTRAGHNRHAFTGGYRLWRAARTS